MKRTDLVLSLVQRMFLFFCIFLVCYIVAAALAYLTARLLPGRPDAVMRISAVVQDVIAFIVPAVVTPLMVTRRPAELLMITGKPKLLVLCLIVLLVPASAPVQEAIIYWNAHLSLPDALAGFEALMRQLEDTAASAVNTLLADTSVAALVVNILIIGILAGVSEELFFRGAFQRLLITGGVNRHVAIWVVAFCFSALHMQFFGFVPRMLLGAYFGYLMVWTRSLWAPVLAHVMNNTVYVISAWHVVRTEGLHALGSDGYVAAPWLIAVSVVFTAILLTTIHTMRPRRSGIYHH